MSRVKATVCALLCFSLCQSEDTICQRDEKIWYYTWSVPPCPAEALNGKKLDTNMCPHSDWAEVRPDHTSVQLFALEAGSQEASHSLKSLLVHPHVIVLAPWNSCLIPRASSRTVPAGCKEFCGCWVLGGSSGSWMTLRKGRQVLLTLSSFTAHLSNESTLKAVCVLSVPRSPLVLLHCTDEQLALLQERVQWSAQCKGIMQNHVAKHMEILKKLFDSLYIIPFCGDEPFFPILWWFVRLCPNLTALRVIISTLNVLTTDL